MGSFMNFGRGQGSERRQNGKAGRRGLPNIETLEGRLLLDGGGNGWHPTSANIADLRNGPLANMGTDLATIYMSYQSGGGNAAGISAKYPAIFFKGDKVGIDIRGSGDFTKFVASMKSLGMDITATSAKFATVEGYIPMNQILTVAQLPATVAAIPNYKPSVNYQGVANNQADASLNADTARIATALTGSGVTVGVLSDSVSQFQNGLADSYRTKDLLASQVTVIQDLPAGSGTATDEGRAMMENIHDIAPGANLAFATAFTGFVGFGNNIQALATQANAKVIVDDVSYFAEPFFQDGIIAQGVDQVTSQNNVAYFSSAANASTDNGYLSTFRGVNATVTGVGTGRFMNFAPSGAAVTNLPIVVNAPLRLTMQFDQPYFTQQPAGSTNDVTSEVDIFILDASGNVVASSTNNNIATHAPIQQLVIPTAGSYTVAIQVVNGPDPGHVEFIRSGNAAVDNALQVSKQFGSAGGTYYPSSVGHNAGENTIGVGAVPWWASTPFLGTNPLLNEPYSSPGPNLTVRNVDGSLRSTPTLVLNPTITGPDGGNTSFFGQVIDTTQIPPVTKTNLSQNLPSFFGTSSAAPNVAAVAALMKQRTPAATNEQIRSALQVGARPMNGATAGTWDSQGGYGLVDAVAAINAIDVLRVITTSPAGGAIVTVAPNGITATFSKAVDFTTISAKDLTFSGVPTTVTSITALKPVALDDPLHPTKILFPFQFTVAPNQLGNGKFSFNIKSPAGGPVILSFEGAGVAGKPLKDFSSSFTINDVTAPRVQNATLNNRVVTVQFDKAMNPATITTNTVYVQRIDSNGVVTILNNIPQFKFSYNTTTNTVTLDYTGLNQVQLGSGTYVLVVKAGTKLPNGSFDLGVTDLVGNKLNGHFTGVFPSGDPNPTDPTAPLPFDNFVDNFGFINVTTPVITTFNLVAASDTGIKGDGNTKFSAPTFIGQIAATFPGTVSGLTILAEFNSLHGGNLDLTPVNGRGYTGSFDVQVTTDANGTFTIPAPFLPEGFQRVRLVVIGQPDSPPLPGLSSSFDKAFKIDQTAPKILSAALSPGAASLPLGTASTPLNALSALSLDVIDPANPSVGPLATPAQVYFPALDPATASNISNYSLINLDEAASSNPTVRAGADKSRFITSATFVATGADFLSAPNRTKPSDPYSGRIDLTFATGLTKGRYQFIVHTTETVNGINYGGVTDAAANALDNSTVPGQSSKDFVLNLLIQPEPIYITSVAADVLNAQGNSLLPRSYYEINPRAGDQVSAPPTTFYVDFSNPLDPAKTYTNSILLIGTANSSGGKPDGDFGDLGTAGLGATGSGFTRFNPPGTTVTLINGKNGTNTRLVLQLPAGTVLPADHYRLYMPNTGASAISDIYGNTLDGEFLGNPATTGSDPNGNPAYEDLLPNGQYRQGMSGDGISGGAFMTGFTVVPTGNLVYARPDYVEDPLLSSSEPDGSLAKPYSVLAPQAAANGPGAGTYNNGDPNGGVNDSENYRRPFDSQYDRAGIGRFARSAFYAASQLSSLGPVVIVGLPGTPQRDPITGVVTQKTFVLQAPAGSDPVVNDGSGSVPFDTVLVFNPGSTVKLQNASLFVQNQGSAIEALGGPNPNDRVNFTSYADDTIAGDTNQDGRNSVPRGGDWGGIVLRNFNQAAPGRTDTFPVDVTLVGPGGAPAISGADDALSTISFATVRYGGGAVPATRGIRYDEITLYNSRPSIVQDNLNGGGSAAQATISGDLDSFREDDLTRGPLIRRTTVANASINGIWVRPLIATGIAQQSDAMTYADNPVTLGGVQNFTFDDPLPYILTSRIEVGDKSLFDTAGQVTSVLNRLYIQPGMMVKSERGAGIEVVTAGSSLIVGDRTYISRWDAEASIDATTGLPSSTYSPTEAGFLPNTVGDSKVIFTTALDNTATTTFFDPLTQQTTVIVPAIDSLNSGGIGQPTAGNVLDASRWGSINLTSGSYGTLDEMEIRYGGGTLNVAGGTSVTNALSFVGAAGGGFQFVPGQGFVFVAAGFGSRYSVTNNSFIDNADAAMGIQGDGLVAADELRPLSSGHPFFRGNVFQRNDLVLNGVHYGGNGLVVHSNNELGSGILREGSNVNVNSVWDSTDLTYIVRGSIVLGPSFSFGSINTGPPPTSYQPETKPVVTLTLQSNLADTLLANGSRIPRPGEPLIIKLDSRGNAAPPETFTEAANITAEVFAGAGFIAGVDNGVDPPADPYIDAGLHSQLRILGIGGNETTGQQRVPVVITSIHDNTVGTTVRGVKLYQAIDGDTLTPAAGDGGLIYFGGNTQADFNILDPRAGNLIDNADLKYLSRVEMQGGGTINYLDLNASGSFDALDDPNSQKRGVFPNLANGQPDPRNFAIQNNASPAMTISNSNLSNFRDIGVLSHPGFDMLAGGVRAGGIRGQGTQLFLYNNTISNTPVGVRVRGELTDNVTFPEVTEIVALNNTFYNNPLGLDVISVVFDGVNSRSHVHVIAMDNIFANSTTAAIQTFGQDQGSEVQYNLYFGNGTNINNIPSGANAGLGNDQPIFGDPAFRDAVNGNFQLTATSAAIDAARSELSLDPTANGALVGTLVPIGTQVLDARGSIRNQNSREPDAGGLFDPTNIPTNILTLPGYTERGYIDAWVPTLASDPQGIPGPDTIAGTWLYKPALIPPGTRGVPGGGERDALGYLRIDDPNKPNVGFGSRPFFDIGAFEYRQLFPPHVTDVAAVVTDPNTSFSVKIPLYSVGGRAGTNKQIVAIQVQLDHSLDPTTVNGSTVLLEASGGDGIFGNGNTANDKFYNLSGKVGFDSSTNILTINIGAAGLVLSSDLYRIFLQGNGTNVLRDPQGNALDGENTVGGDPNGAQLALPSGDGFPGGTFYDTFVINTVPATPVPGTFGLDASTDTNVIGDNVTSNNLPAFSGNIQVALPNIVPLAGQTVILDVSTKGDTVLDANGQPIFDRLNAGTAFTDVAGHFVVTVGQDGAKTGLVTSKAGIPDSPYNVGPDGIIRTADDSHYTWVRVRIIDQSGNVSNLPTDPYQSFLKNGALSNTVIDTAPPKITSFSPAGSTQITPDSSGALTFVFTTDKNIALSSLTTGSLLVKRAGPDGQLGTADDVNIAINPATITTTYLKSGAKGPEKISFQVTGGAPNDLYAVTIKGTGTTPVIDIAGNALAGLYNGSFPTGQTGGAGTDFTLNYVVFSTGSISTRWVGPAADVTDPTAAAGSRANPFPTISLGIKNSGVGDVVQVLPGVYTENVTLKPYVRVLSAGQSSTDTNILPGNAQQTVIRAPSQLATATGHNITVSASNIVSVPGIDTELAGFTIASPLIFDPALGPIDPNSQAVSIINADVLLDRDYMIDSQVGVFVSTSGSQAPTPRLLNNGFIGNTVGLILADSNATSIPRVTQVFNNDFAFNTIGLMAIDSSASLLVGNIVNNIFWQNHDTTTARGGTAIFSQVTDKLIVRSNVFANNGPLDKSTADDAVNVGSGFVPSALTGTPDSLGNLTGIPAFVSPRDPRPGSDGPAIFFTDANFDLTNKSIAIDAANPSFAPATDFLQRGRVKITGRGFPGTGPADIGAFEFHGAGGSAVGGAFRVASTSIAADGSVKAAGASFTPSNAPTSITVTFSDNVSRSTVTPGNLVLSGSGLLPTGPARAVSVTWLDSHTAVFKLSGGYNTQGTVNLTITGGTIVSLNGATLNGFNDSFKIVPFIASSTTVVPTTTPTTPSKTVTPVTTPLTPVAAPAPVALTPAPAKAPTTPVHRKPAKFRGHVVKK